MRRSRPLVVLVGMALAGVVMLSWTQTWFTVRLDATSAVVSTVSADGSTAAPQYTALALAGLALFLALTIAGPVLRVILAAVEMLLGVVVVVTGVLALADPIAASKEAIADVAGVSDLAAVRHIATSVQVEPWPYVGIAGGALSVVLGALVLVIQRQWPGPSRKYGAVSSRPAKDPLRDSIVDWDDLSAGVDPTSATVPTGVETTRAAARASGTRRGASEPADHGGDAASR